MALVALSLTLQSDVLPPDSHYLEKCFRFENLDQYPDITLVSVVFGPGDTTSRQILPVKNNTCIYKGYKFNRLMFYALKKEVVAHCADLYCLDFSTADREPVFVEDSFGGSTSDKTTLSKVESVYRIGKVNARTIEVYKDREIRTFDDRQEITRFRKPHF